MCSKISYRAPDAELVLTQRRLYRVVGNLLAEDSSMAGFVVAYLSDPLISLWRVPGILECGLVEGLYAILIEGIYCPFGAHQILEKKVIWAGAAV